MTHPETNPRIAGTGDEAVEIARELGYPVKLMPVHRTVGGFVCRDEPAVRAAAARCILSSPSGEIEVSRHEG